MLLDSNTIFAVLPVTASHGRAGSGLKLFSHPHEIFRRRRAECRNLLQGFARFEPLSLFCASNRHISHLRMSGSCESDLSHQSGNDSDDKGSVASSHVSGVPYLLGSRKQARQQTQIAVQAWVFYGLITADATLLHAEPDDPEEGPFPRLKSMLLPHWTSVYPHLEARIQSSSCISVSSAISQASWDVSVMKRMHR